MTLAWIKHNVFVIQNNDVFLQLVYRLCINFKYFLMLLLNVTKSVTAWYCVMYAYIAVNVVCYAKIIF